MSFQHIRKRDESLLFLKQLIRNPKSLGALVPSSQMLADFICGHVPTAENHLVVEVGAGTGRFTQGLLKAGIKPENLVVLEIDPIMCSFLRKNFPHINVIEGNANQLHTLLPEGWVGKIGTIISGIPMVNLSAEDQEQIISSCFQVLSELGSVLQFTYGPLSPLSSKKLGLTKKRLGHVFMNFPPATVWQYCRQSEWSLEQNKKESVTFERLRKIRRMVGLKVRSKKLGLEE